MAEIVISPPIRVSFNIDEDHLCYDAVGLWWKCCNIVVSFVVDAIEMGTVETRGWEKELKILDTLHYNEIKLTANKDKKKRRKRIRSKFTFKLRK